MWVWCTTNDDCVFDPGQTFENMLTYWWSVPDSMEWGCTGRSPCCRAWNRELGRHPLATEPSSPSAQWLLPALMGRKQGRPRSHLWLLPSSCSSSCQRRRCSSRRPCCSRPQGLGNAAPLWQLLRQLQQRRLLQNVPSQLPGGDCPSPSIWTISHDPA